MISLLLVTLEILLLIVAPLLYLYLRGTWALRNIIVSLFVIPVLWYLIYSPLHELSHVAGTYAVGGKVTYIKLIPSFWLGEFARAWITTEDITQGWQRLVMTGFPYFLDIAGLWLVRRGFARSAFLVGLVFMLLCLRPLFDLVCETIAYVAGSRGDVYWIAQSVGEFLTWAFLTLSIGLSIVSILTVLRRFTKSSETSPAVAISQEAPADGDGCGSRSHVGRSTW
jgi:hypothetical protein